jgi:hypothetical protein
VSDEAFALLLIDNYLEKWKTRADEEEAVRVGPVGCLSSLLCVLTKVTSV